MDYMDDSQPDGEQGLAQGAMDQTSDSGKTALIDSSICPGMKAGDTLDLKIEKVLDSGEYEVSYAPDADADDQSEGEPSASEETSSAPQGGMSSYMS